MTIFAMDVDLMDHEFDDTMDYEYTNAPNLNKGLYSNTPQNFVPPAEGSFKIPARLFQTFQTKTSMITNAICDKIGSFSINDDVKEETEESVVNLPKSTELPVTESLNFIENSTLQSSNMPEINEEKSLVLVGPSLTPPVDNLPSINTYESSEPVEQEQIPSTPISSSTHTSTHTSTLPTVGLSSSFYSSSAPPPPQQQQEQEQQQPRQEPSNIHFYYDFPPDPLVQSRGTIYYLTGLFKIMFRAILFFTLLYISYHICANFTQDMRNKIAKYESVMLDEKLFCQHEYTINRCSPNTRLPAIVELCRNWEKCIHEPIAVSKSRVLAETLAEMVEGFLGSLSLKSLVFSIILVLGFSWCMKGDTTIINQHNSNVSMEDRLQLENSKKKSNKKIKPLAFEEKLVL